MRLFPRLPLLYLAFLLTWFILSPFMTVKAADLPIMEAPRLGSPSKDLDPAPRAAMSAEDVPASDVPAEYPATPSSRMIASGSLIASSSGTPPSPGVASASTIASWSPDPEITAMLASDPTLLEKMLQKAMLKVVKNPATLTIEIKASDSVAASQGRLQQVSVHQEGGEIDHLVLSKADFFFFELQLNTTKLFKEEKIENIFMKNANMDVIIKEADLNIFLAVKAKKIKVDDPKVRLFKGRMELEGSTRYSFVKVKFFASGGFTIHEAREVWFHPKKLRVNQLAMPRAFVGGVVKRINPVLNLAKFPFRLNLKEIRIEEGSLHFTSFSQEP